MSDRERFDAWLDDELHHLLNPVVERPAPAARYRDARTGGGRLSLRFASGAGAAFGAKAATGLVVAAFAAGATATALTGTPNPAAWPGTVEQAVETCRSTAATDGLGACVSAIATQHGESVASAAREDHPSPHPAHSDGARTPAPVDSDEPSPEETHRPQPSHRPTPRTSLSPEGDHSPRPTPSASPSLHRPEPTPTPTRTPDSD